MTTALAIIGVLAAVLALGEILVRGHRGFWPRLILQLGCLAALTLALGRSAGSPLAPIVPTGSPAERVLERVLAIVWWVIAARLGVLLARLVITHEVRPRESRIMSDLVAGLIYIAAALAVVAFVLDIPVRGLLATSGVIAIVLGLALQSTLGDLFSGIAVGVERPYRTGDVVSIDGGIAGRVLEVNWRSTHVQVGQDVAVVPNSVVAKSRLVNRSAPTPASGESVEVRVHPEVPIRRVLPVLQAALDSCERLASGVAPSVACTALAGDGSTFTLGFAAVSADQVGRARTEVLSQVHRHLFHAGLPLAVGGQVPAPGWATRLLSADELLARSDLFSGMSPEHRALLAAQLRPMELQAGETLFAVGGAPDALFMLGTGTIEIAVGDPAAPTRRHRLAPGETLGLVALMTGQPYTATGTAVNPVRAFRLDRAGLASALAAAPELAEEMEQAVGRATAIMARLAAEDIEPENEQRVALLGRLRVFLRGLG